jgi:hypothetical protein
MSCERYEHKLALHVEADLAPDEAVTLERHLLACERCRALLRGLEDSQRQLKGLADEPFDEEALLSLRLRIQAAATRGAGPAGFGRHWLWAAAVGALVVALAVGILLRRPAASPLPSQVQHAASSAPEAQPRNIVERPTRLAADGTDGTPMPGSTGHGDRSVSWGRRSTSRVVPLTREEADQLARAVVVVSRSQHLPRPAPVPDTEPGMNVVILGTADPRVVIYWQVDSNGG